MIETKKYARKTFLVEAVQVTEENMEAVAEWCHGKVRSNGKNYVSGQSENFIKVRVYRPLSDRQTKAFVGDWVLFAGTGYKVYPTEAFQKNFEPVGPQIPAEKLLFSIFSSDEEKRES